MKLFLTSVAANVLDKIAATLNKNPKELKVAFIPTAGDPYGDDKPWMEADRQKLIDLGFDVFDFDLKDKTEDEVNKILSATDIIFVAGGNTFYLLEKAKKCGLDKIVRKFKSSDKIYIGSSAGSCVAGPDIEPIKYGDDPGKANLENTKAFGLVDFVVLPHYDPESPTENYKKEIEEFGNKYKLVKLTNNQMVVVDGGEQEVIGND